MAKKLILAAALAMVANGANAAPAKRTATSGQFETVMSQKIDPQVQPGAYYGHAAFCPAGRLQSAGATRSIRRTRM